MTAKTDVVRGRDRAVAKLLYHASSPGEVRYYEYGHPARVGLYTPIDITFELDDEREHHVSWGFMVEPSHSFDWSKAYTVFIPFDFDCPASIDECRRAVSRFLSLLKTSVPTAYPPEIHFTGCKGYRVFILLDRPYPLAKVAEVAKRLAAFNKRIDVQPLNPRGMFRLPYTVNRKCGGYCVPVDRGWREVPAKRYGEYHDSLGVASLDDLEAILPEEEHVAVEVVRVRYRPEKKTSSKWSWVEKVLERGLPDGRRRFIWRVLSRYLRLVKGVDEETCVEICKEFIENSCRNWGNCSKIYDSAVREFCRAAAEPAAVCNNEPCRPWRLETICEKDPELCNAVKAALERG